MMLLLKLMETMLSDINHLTQSIDKRTSDLAKVLAFRV